MQRRASYSIQGVGCWVLLIGSLTAAARASELFAERSETSGLDFVHFNGMSGEYYFPEIMGAGGGGIRLR
jgi:enediyne biosynthesis protein E4